MKTAVIMQPTYLPWLGYFDLMDQADVFVLLDSVQFDKRSWQQRNRIKNCRGEQRLTIPVLTKGRRDQTIRDARIDPTAKFREEHLKALEMSYAKSRHFRQYADRFASAYNKQHVLLADLTIDLISIIKESLGVGTEMVRSSALEANGAKTELLVEICRKVGARRYLSPVRSKEYIGEGALFRDHEITLEYHYYQHPKYTQLHGEFIPYLSVVDLLFNHGEESLAIIRSGRRTNEQTP
ncbi:MAG: WbqC family protein [Elusimicrobiota bacterium]